MDVADFFKDRPEALAIHEAVQAEISRLGRAKVRVTKSQVGFRRARLFAATWPPGQHLRGERPPLVLTIYLRRRDSSSRWKEVVEPAPGRFTHHLELQSARDVDGFVRKHLAEAWADAA